ncbi:hypothetical protein AGABI2DRAFT_192872 [Agaricus bisporus var. bisporus H97]|uniref:hypothetical protein n=1 Tax=Agaricus bisporus var. bisporus (strain H97 / ATCC MYA-4626 / FGSC 10389) TaxID=936046 RepID=UPI00029F4FFA|nr:hypothetical protein AGABI2DRAFT_192872 [Agaricus bisporus var. bisporus H97]EKV47715.1 hypothetical protein AGABI2DRAFT_192872 [Agaricus bisporus var. bisporus H97]
MLGQCTNLIEFRLRDPVVFRVEGVQFPSSPFVLPCLELFEWPVYHNSEADRPMLQYARMPALQTLIWNRLGVFDAPSDALSNTFFDHFSSTLTTLQIEGGIIRSGLSMFSHFLTLSGVKHLILEGCSDHFIDDVFSKLASEVCTFENREMLVLPKLQSIWIGDIDGHLDQRKVLQTFRRRCSWPIGSLKENPFRLEITEGDVYWTPEFRMGLNKMVEEGCKVELWENSKPVGWLSR